MAVCTRHHWTRNTKARDRAGPEPRFSFRGSRPDLMNAEGYRSTIVVVTTVPITVMVPIMMVITRMVFVRTIITAPFLNFTPGGCKQHTGQAE